MASSIAKTLHLLKPRRRWVQFRLRTLFASIAALCVPLAWLGWKMDHKWLEREVIADITRSDGFICYNWQGPSSGGPPGPAWLRMLLGEDFFADVVFVRVGDEIVDADLVRLKSLKRLRKVSLSETGVTDAGIRHLVALTSLRQLNVSGTKVTAAGIDEFQKTLPNCKVIR